MCGIAGFSGPDAGFERADRILVSMTDAIRYRGPDDSGAWIDRELQVGLGHRRLSIVDLSPAGHQPMTSASGRFVLVFNGEIYNHLALRKDLLSAQPELQFRGHSDTEVMLAALDYWGLDRTLEKLNGMFAIALVDRKDARLYLARDRIGEKPLYYAHMGNSFLFGSELKALKQHPAWKADIDPNSLKSYLRYGYVPSPGSIYRDAYRVPSGGVVSVELKGNKRNQTSTRLYWSVEQAYSSGLANPLSISDDEAMARLRDLLTDAVGMRMVADVPLGAFLSGGIDSSLVVALMQRLSSKPVKTFSIGFGESRFNEAESAKAVARHLGTEHLEFYVSPQDSLDVIPKLPTMYDEPFADSSQIPTHLVSLLARRHVTVSLSGDGGDELFCGYDRYDLAYNLSRGLEGIPAAIRNAAASAIRAVPMRAWNVMGSVLPERVSAGRTGDRMYKLAHRFRYGDFPQIFDSTLALWDDPRSVMAKSMRLEADKPIALHAIGSKFEQMMAHDQVTYLPDDILVKVDRASMAVSLEARVPLLDHRIVEFAWQLPMSFKRRDGVSKWLLKQLLYDMVPRALVDRPKQGFGVPIEHWLRKELRGWATDLLSADQIAQDGFLNPAVVSRHLEEHLSGTRSWATQLWTVLMFQAWLHSK
jgi:asparagine synthase (glutamine-hydrolysing)